jgi:arylsulfatase A-like enzyme
MKKFFEKIKISYLDASALFFSSLLLLMLISLWYRLEIFRLIRATYANLDLLTFSEYFSMSLYYDTAVLIYLSMLLPLVILPFAGFKRFRYIPVYIYLMVVFGMLLSGVEFFRVYETTFRPGFIGKENSDYFLSLSTAYFAEATAPYYIRLVTAGIVVLPALLFLFHKKSSRIDHELTRKFYLPATLTLLAVIMFLARPESIYSSIAKKFPHVPDKSITRTLSDISRNPLFNIFLESREQQEDSDAVVLRPGKKPFHFGFDRDSLTEKKEFPRLNIIPGGKKYNIILYFFESLSHRYLDLKYKGKTVTPEWKRLMKNSMVMNNHYTNFPLSANALFSVLTSAYDPVFKGPFDDNLVTVTHPEIKIKSLPEILKGKGYRTCLIHTWKLDYVGQKKFLKDRGFDTLLEMKQLKKMEPNYEDVGLGIDERAMINPAINFIKKKKDPFFMVFLPVNPHSPYFIPYEERFMITGDIPGDLPYRKMRWLDYINSLHFADYAMGLLIKKLEKEKLLEDTLVFIFADHGQAFYQHRMNYLHRHFIYEENVHIPFIIYNKKLFKSRIDFNRITSHIDILPTILDILSLKKEREHEGVSILSKQREKFALLHTYWDEDFNGVRDRKWKYIMRMKDRFEELYDLENDPLEKKNMAETKKEIAERYRKVVERSQEYKKEYFDTVLKYGITPGNISRP